jgi:hypothetical protein
MRIEAAVKTIDGIPQLAPFNDPPPATEMSYTTPELLEAPVAISNTAVAEPDEQVNVGVNLLAAANAADPTGARVSLCPVPRAAVVNRSALAPPNPPALTSRILVSVDSRAKRVAVGVVVAAPT